MKSGTGEVHMSPGMAYWSVIWPESVVRHTGVGMVMTECLVTLKHVLHCDVSLNNLIFKQAPPGTLHTLYLIDFHYAICLQPIDGEVTNYPKGTVSALPFLFLTSVDKLSGDTTICFIAGTLMG